MGVWDQAYGAYATRSYGGCMANDASYATRVHGRYGTQHMEIMPPRLLWKVWDQCNGNDATRCMGGMGPMHMEHMPPYCMEGMSPPMFEHMPPECMGGFDGPMMQHMPHDAWAPWDQCIWSICHQKLWRQCRATRGICQDLEPGVMPLVVLMAWLQWGCPNGR